MRKIVLLLMCAVLAIGQLSAQSRKISGKILNAAGVPIPNASVLIRGNSAGTSSDESGNFTISVSAKTKALVVSSINYSTTEVNITSDNMTVILQPANGGNLSEVLVVAYGSVKKTNIGLCI
jgi:hypothetical protein